MQPAILESVTKILSKAGYSVTDLIETRPRCFDVVAKKDETVLLLKVLYNIDSLKPEMAEDLKKLAKVLGASPIIVGERFKFDFLDRGVVYSRYGIPVVNLATFYDFIIEGIPPFVYSAPGGYYVRLDSEKIKEVRERLGFSLGDMAKMLGVSRRTVKKYEEGIDTSLSNATKIEEILGTHVIKAIDLMQFADLDIQEDEDDITGMEGEEGEIVEQLKIIGISVYPIKHAPFDAVSKAEDRKILTGVKQVRGIEKRARILGRISETLSTRAAYIVDRELKKDVGSVVFLLKEELHCVSSAKDFILLLNEKSGEC
jgi:putative transcriptional regulator